MSEVIVTPSVFGIAALPLGLVIGGAVLTAALVRRLTNSMEARSRKAFEQAVKTLPELSADVLRPPSLVEHETSLRLKPALSRMQSLQLPPTEAMRVSTLISLASAPYVIENPAVLEQPLTAMLSAKTLEETRQAGQALLDTVRMNHRGLFTRALTQACTNAARKIGFSTIETGRGPLDSMRVIATDAEGRSVITEIRPGKNGDPGLAAEVVGVQDGSCHQILNAFENALAEQGVRYTPPRRKSTGGVCELEAAKEFVRRKLDRAGAAKPAAVADDRQAQRRAQRLNQKKVQLTR